MTDTPPPLIPSTLPPRRGIPKWVIIVAGVAATAMVIASLGGLWFVRQVNPPGSAGDEVALEIPEGASMQRIGELLADAGVITRADVFRVYLKFNDAPDVQAGKYALAKNMSMGDVLDLLAEGPEIDFDRVTVPEGLTLDEIADRVERNERLSGARFRELLTSLDYRSNLIADPASLEGLLFPDTYFLDPQENERELLERMLSAMNTATAELGYDNAPKRVGLTPYETLIVASLIEREARVPEDRAKISRVIHNRIAAGMRLEIDATVIFAHGGGITRVLNEHLQIDSPYNTYRVSGLPPGPIAAPGRASLEAAINPVDGPWLFYVVIDAEGRHGFAETFAGHQDNIRQAEEAGVR